MFKDNNSIILVDDNEAQLADLTRLFNEHGIGCRAFTCDGYDLPETPLKGVRLAFFDINYNNEGDDKAMFGTLESVIKGFISDDNGPYVIVFWSNKVDKMEEFKTFVNRDLAHAPKNPLAVIPLDKNAFLENQDELPNQLKTILNKPIVACLFSFQEQLSESADKVLKSITDIINGNDQWGQSEDYESKLIDVFAKISIQKAGLAFGITSPDKAIKEALAPVFLHELLKNDSHDWKDFLKLEEKDPEQLKRIELSDIAPQLNTIMHIDAVDIKDKEARGIVRGIKTCDEYVKQKIGCTLDEWMSISVCPKDKFTKAFKYVALEFSAACDYSNQKPRTHRYMLGILYNKGDHDVFYHKGHMRSFLKDNIYIPGFTFDIGDKGYGLMLDLNFTFVESADDPFSILETPLFRIKHELMNIIGEQYARHISRLGFDKY